jgi:hypothetical protein
MKLVCERGLVELKTTGRLSDWRNDHQRIPDGQNKCSHIGSDSLAGPVGSSYKVAACVMGCGKL